MAEKTVTDFLAYATAGEAVRPASAHDLPPSKLIEWAKKWYASRGEKADPDKLQVLVNAAFLVLARRHATQLKN